jgi:Retrotransposon gag protein
MYRFYQIIENLCDLRTKSIFPLLFFNFLIIRASVGIRAQMADANHGRGRGRGRGRGEEEQRHRDQRDLEIAAMGRRIRELERLLAEAREASTNGEEGEESDTIDSSEAGNEDEGFNPWGNPNRGRNQRIRPGPDPSFQNLGVKIDIPEFEGKSHLDEFIDWLHTVERVFDVKNLSHEQKVKLVDIKLRKYASIWWEHVRNRRVREGKPKIRTWDKMKKNLMAKFLPAQYRYEAFIEYHNLKQKTLILEQYTNEFDISRMRCDVVEEDEQIVARYLAGLKPELSDVLYLQQYYSYNDVCRLALKVESQQKRRVSSYKFQNRSSGIETDRRASPSNPNPTSKTTQTPNPKIYPERG